MEKNTAYPLAVNGISKRFKSHIVLDNISFELHKGEIFGLIGMNGVGKTTLMKIMLDLLKPDNGDVHFFGLPAITPESRKPIAYLPEKFQPSPFLKGDEFLSLALSYFNKTFDPAIAHEKAKLLALPNEAFSRRVGQYSKGMGQKLGLLSIFLSEAALLLLDEPMSGLDPGARIQLKELLLDYKQQGNSIFFSSHILADMEEICDRVAVLHDAKLIFVGKPQEFQAQYQADTLERAFLKATVLHDA